MPKSQSKSSKQPTPTVEELAQRIDELTSDLQRSRADFENYRRRGEAEKARSVELGESKAVLKLLPVIDTVERAIRPQTITRKNALFAGSDGGGRTWATIATLLTTARLNDVDPFVWLKITLERIAAGWPNRDLDALLPWNFKKS